MKPLNPIMAVLVIASVGVSPLRTLAADGDKTAAPAATNEDKNPVNVLAKILAENPVARTDAGKRIEDFLLKTENGKSFVDSGVNTTALGAVAREWGEREGAGRVAMLYFVAGPGLAAPGWALKDPVLSKTFTSGMKWEGRLRAALADWTGKNQIDKTKEKTQVTAFLNDAAEKAAAVFADAREKKEIDLSIEGNNTTGAVVPDTRRSTRTGLDGASRQYAMEDLYQGDGAVWGNVSGPKDAGSRTISMKIYTKRLDDGSTVNEIGIFDITDRNDIFGQRFPIDSGNQSFTLDDRTAGHKKYDLKFETLPDGNRKVTFARPDGGPALETTVWDLFTKRANQAADMGNIVKIGGEEFYTLPQGGAKSALALFPKSAIDGRTAKGDSRDLVPALYAEVGVRGADGRNANVPSGANDGPHLGKVGEKEFHLEFNKTLGVWEVKDGYGTKPPPKPTTGDGGTTTPGGGTTTPGGGTTPRPEGEVSIADLETLLLKDPGCKKNPEDIKDLAANLKGKYGIIACANAIDGLQQIVLVPKSADFPAQQLKYSSVEGFKLQRARFVDHYLVLQFDKQVQYLDLLKPDKSGFALANMLSVEEKAARDFLDMGIFLDALKNYLGVSGEALTEVPKRVAQALGSKPRKLTGAFANGKLVVNAVSGGDVYLIWPNLEMPGGGKPPAANPYASLSGPANAMDGAVSSVDEQFPDKIDLPESRQASVVSGRKQADIALYESVALAGKPELKKYFLMFKYNGPNPKDPAKPAGEKEVFRQKHFEVFNSTNPLPANFEQQGLVGMTVVKDRVASGYRFVSGSTVEKGVLAVFQNKQVSGDNQKDKAENCVGPIVWWGVKDRDAALKVCQEDKF